MKNASDLAEAVYLDSSAAVKLGLNEPESTALRIFLGQYPDRVSSWLLRLEFRRVLARTQGLSEAYRVRAEDVLGGIAYISIDNDLLERAAKLAPTHLKSLDAIHLATALSVPALAGMVVYDPRLAAAAAAHGIRVFSPGAGGKA